MSVGDLAGAAQQHTRDRIVIQPPRGWVPLDLRELWRNRELFYFLTWRDLKVRYKQTALGAAWGMLQPFLLMVVFSFFFAHLTGVSSEGVPYPLFAYSALIPWTYFSYALNHSSNSVVDSANLLRRVYFPRLVIPISSMIAGLFDFAMAFIVLVILMIYYEEYPSIEILALPLFLLLTIATALSVGVWFAALNVSYRDIRYILPFLTQLWLPATPVAYPSSLLDEPWRTIFGFNPMAGVVEGFRWCLLGTEPPGPMILVSTAMTLVLLISGLYYFKRMEKRFADII